MMVRVLGRRALAELLTVGDHLEAAESAFRLLGSGGATLPPPLHIEAIDGGFHAKGGALALGRHYAAVKVNGNFPANPERHGLPTVQGALLLFDGERGQPLALMDSIELTIARTAAANRATCRSGRC